jgi:hypothetical protein
VILPELPVLLPALGSNALDCVLAGLISPIAVLVNTCTDLLLSIVHSSGGREGGVRTVVPGWWRRMQVVHILRRRTRSTRLDLQMAVENEEAI